MVIYKNGLYAHYLLREEKMLDTKTVKRWITDRGLFDDGTRDYVSVIVLLFGTLEEGRQASIHFFSETILSFGFTLDEKQTKAFHSKLNQMCPKYLTKIALGDLTEEKRMELCRTAAGTTSHEGAQRTRALFELDKGGISKLQSLKEEFADLQ